MNPNPFPNPNSSAANADQLLTADKEDRTLQNVPKAKMDVGKTDIPNYEKSNETDLFTFFNNQMHFHSLFEDPDETLLFPRHPALPKSRLHTGGSGDLSPFDSLGGDRLLAAEDGFLRKRPFGAYGGDQVLFKKEKRAQKSREARLKKKIYVRELEEEVEELQKKIEEFKSLSKRPAKVDNLLKSNENGLKAEIVGPACRAQDSAVNGHGPFLKEKLIVLDIKGQKKFFSVSHEEIKEYSKKFVSSPHDRIHQALYYLDRVSECIIPGDQVKYLLWLLTQNAKFYENDTIQRLFRDFGVSPHKIERALQKRDSFQGDKEKIDKLNNMTKTLQREIKEHLVSVSELTNAIRGNLTPLQMMRFFLWSTEGDCEDVMREIEEEGRFCNPFRVQK